MKTFDNKLKSFILPWLLGISVMSSIIYDFRGADVVVLTIVELLFEIAVFFILDFLYTRKNKLLSGIVYVLLLGAVLYLTVLMVIRGYKTSGIIFNNWFYGATRYVPQYLYALMLGGGFVLSSAMYYFTQVRYRGIFTLLLVLLPFAVYAKRLDFMASGYLAAILFFYLLVMIHSRQTAADSGIVVVPDKAYIVSVAAFAAVVIGVLFVLPMPEIQSMQEKDASFLNNISFFSTTANPMSIGMQDSSSRRHGEVPSGEELFTVRTDYDTLYLKSQSYSYFENNDWHYGDDITEEAGNVWTDPQITVPGMAVTEKLAILRLYCEENKDSDKIALIDEYIQIEEEEITVTTAADIRFSLLPLPENTFRVSLISPSFAELLYSGGYVYCNGEWQTRWPAETYNAHFHNNAEIRQLAEKLEMTSSDWDKVMSWYKENALEGREGFSIETFRSVNSDRSMAEKIDSGEYDVFDDSLRRLAQEITAGCETDYEKAAALERYFTSEGYDYSLTYIPDDESIEYFVFDSKTGLCTDFATAMTLMARSVGLTARYCEGYYAFEKNVDNQTELVVRDSYAHAFVEVYMPACGWVIFEPTVSSFPSEMYEQQSDAGVTGGGRIEKNDVYLAVIALAFLFAVALLSVPVGRAIYIAFIRHISREEAVKKLYSRIIRRLSKKTGTDLSAHTVSQAKSFAAAYGISFDMLADAFEKSFYGGIELTADEFESSVADYKSVRSAKIKMQVPKPLTD